MAALLVCLPLGRVDAQVENTGTGTGVLGVNSGSDNTGDGFSALLNNTSGSDNTGVGARALLNNTSGGENTAVGFGSLFSNTTGYYNVAIGNNAGYHITTGSDNILIGSTGNADNAMIRIGTAGMQTRTDVSGIYGATPASGVAVHVNSSGQLGTGTSSARFKDNIENMSAASDTLYSLRPVSFRYQPELDPQGIAQYGLIAEDSSSTIRTASPTACATSRSTRCS